MAMRFNAKRGLQAQLDKLPPLDVIPVSPEPISLSLAKRNACLALLVRGERARAALLHAFTVLLLQVTLAQAWETQVRLRVRQAHTTLCLVLTLRAAISAHSVCPRHSIFCSFQIIVTGSISGSGAAQCDHCATFTTSTADRTACGVCCVRNVTRSSTLSQMSALALNAAISLLRVCVDNATKASAPVDTHSNSST